MKRSNNGATMPYGVADFDSAVGMLKSTSRVLQRQDFPAIGSSRWLERPVRMTEWLPTPLRRAIYAMATGFEAIPRSAIDRVSAKDIAKWMTDLYPEEKYPAVIIGSASGALTHLAAALHAPLLPQTVLVPIRRHKAGSRAAIDDPRGDLAQAQRAGEALLAANPEFQLHQMHDPNQDRLSLQYISYFRPKFRSLPTAFRSFLTERLKPGATIIVSDCTQRWPTTRVADRYLFQFGAVGGMEAEEYHSGSTRVADLLARYRTGLSGWDPPPPDEDSPEAEWGFESALLDEIEEIARARGFRLVRLSFPTAESLSGLIADLYREWYRRRGIEPRRLLAESFVLVEPYWTLRTGSVPFWMTFASRDSLEGIRDYLQQQSEPFESICMTQFPHGTVSVGLPTIEEWRSVLRLAQREGSFLGVNEAHYPHHFSALARWYVEASSLPERHPLPEPMPFEEFARFCEGRDRRYSVRLAA
jgi:hypothetical protein